MKTFTFSNLIELIKSIIICLKLVLSLLTSMSSPYLKRNVLYFYLAEYSEKAFQTTNYNS